jgi:hypothetical protein
MNRKQFLKNCAGSLCCCFAAGGLAPAALSAAETNAPGTNSPGKPISTNSAEAWRSKFVQRRYAKLIEILGGRMDEPALNEILRNLGNYCSGTDNRLQKFRGDFDGYQKYLNQSPSGDQVTFDRKQGVITMTGPERNDCWCPLISLRTNTPKVACNCSLGWQQHTWETVLGKPVKVELVESVLHGGKRCIFKIHVLEQLAGGNTSET